MKIYFLHPNLIQNYRGRVPFAPAFCSAQNSFCSYNAGDSGFEQRKRRAKFIGLLTCFIATTLAVLYIVKKAKSSGIKFY